MSRAIVLYNSLCAEANPLDSKNLSNWDVKRVKTLILLFVEVSTNIIIITIYIVLPIYYYRFVASE